MENSKGLLVKKVSAKQIVDSGMALVLILLILNFITKSSVLVIAATVVLVVNMSLPKLLSPFAYLWLSLSNILGWLVSKVLLSVVYFMLVLPISFIRRLLQKDTLQLRQFKQTDKSVYITRNHQYLADDLKNPF